MDMSRDSQRGYKFKTVSLVLSLRWEARVVAAILQRGVAPIHGVAHNLKASSIVSVNISASTLGE